MLILLAIDDKENYTEHKKKQAELEEKRRNKNKNNRLLVLINLNIYVNTIRYKTSSNVLFQTFSLKKNMY